MYRIVNWDHHFENNRSRALKELDWVPMPNKQDGDGYTELLDHKDAASHYGAWCAIVLLASKCNPRGTLLRDGDIPHDTRSISRITRIPSTVIAAALHRLVHEVRWLEIVPDPVATQEVASSGTQVPDSGTPLRKSDYGMEGNRREEKGTEKKGTEEYFCSEIADGDSKQDEDSPAALIFPTVGTPAEWYLTIAKLAEYSETYPGIDCLAEARKARQWCIDNPRNQKTAKGMTKFLGGWLGRAQNSSRPNQQGLFKNPSDPRNNFATLEAYLGRAE